ncbi:MAG: carboxypeptidase-like regulatory domain-containing protein [Jatrophihabitantaceae bacterium]
MTRPPLHGRGLPAAEPPPQARLHAVSRTGAGNTVVVELGLVNQADAPRMMTVSVLGLDSSWLPLPLHVGPVAVGASRVVELVLRPPSGTVAARYPFVVAVQASDPASRGAATATTMAEGSLVVDEPSRLSMEVSPIDSTAVFGRRIEVLLRNTGQSPARVELKSEVSNGAHLRLSRHLLQVPAGGSARVRGRLTLTRPRLFGGRARHPFLVAARGLGAPTSVTGALTSRPMVSPLGMKLLAIVTVLGLWAALAGTGIPMLAKSVRGNQANPQAASSQPAAPSGSATAGGSGSGGSGSGATGSAGKGGAQPPKPAPVPVVAKAAGVRLNGIVTGTAPAGVKVSLQPTSLVDEKAAGAQPVGQSAKAITESRRTIGKISAEQLSVRAQTAVSAKQSTLTRQNGSWSFAGISAPGYYLLTFAKPGYQTRQYILNAADADATEPLPVAMSAGHGSLTGRITGPDGAIGGATITISDGQNVVATSSNSSGSLGDWKVEGLSTPGAFLISASKDGLSLESSLVTLAAGQSKSLNLGLKSGMGSLVGTVAGTDSLGVSSGVGGATVTATDGTITRTATTVTSGPVGRYTLPALPAPGKYTVTIAEAGFLPQTHQVRFGAGQSKVVVDAMLTPATAVVGGAVTDSAGLGLVGAGLVLTGPANTYKTMSVSNPLGSFRFNGVAPGTYVLGAELYGRSTSYATVTAKVGGVASVTLKLAPTPGGVLPASSHVRGRITDARSGGPLSCDQADEYDPLLPPGSQANLDLCKINVGVDVSQAAVDAACAPGGAANPLIVCGVDPSQEYTVPSIDLLPVTGLLPGLHRVVVSAPGYESGAVDVQVPLGATVEAAQLALYPSATVVGTVNAAVGSLSTGPDLIVVDDPDEPVPTGQDYAHQIDYRTCVLVLPSSPAPATAPTCTLVPPSSPGGVQTCLPSPAVGKCSLTSTSNGSYTVRGLAHGAYLVYVHPLNPEYRPVSGAQLILDRGATGRYDANLHRLARLVLSVLAPNESGGLVNATDPVTVTVTPAPLAAQPLIQTGVAGRVRIVALSSGSHTVSASKGAFTGTMAVPVGEDQELNTQLAMTQSIPQLIGWVTSSYTGSTQGLANASVTVSGVVAYSGTTPIRAQVNVVTDSRGCFAVTADGNAPTSGMGACATNFADIPRARLALVVGQADVSVTAADFNAYNVTGMAVTTGSLIAVNLAPTARTISGTVTINPADANVRRSNVNITVNRKATGAGTVDVSVDDNGALSWSDSEYPQSNLVRPGNYQLTASMTGYASATVSFTCELGVDCVVPTMELQQLGSLEISTVDGAGVAVPNAIFVLSGGGTTPVTQTAPPGSASVTFSSLTPGAAYKVRIQAAGYAFGSTGADIAVACGGGAASISITPGAQANCVATLNARATIVGTTEAVFGADITQALGNVLLTATYCGAGVTTLAGCPATASVSGFTAISGADGRFRITGTNSRDGLAAGGWVVDMSASGYTSQQREFFQVSTGDTDSTRLLKLDANKVNLKLGIANSASNASADLVTDATLVLTPSDGSQAAVTQTTVGTGNLYVFNAIVPTTYTLQISGPNIATLNVQLTVFVGVANQTIYVRTDVRTSSISGIVSGEQGTSQVASPLDGVTVSLIKISDSSVVSTTTSGGAAGTGFFGFSPVPDDSYVVRFAKTGYVTLNSPTSVSSGQNPTLSPSLERIKNNVVVNFTASNGFAVDGAKAYLIASPGSSNPPQAPQTLTGTAPSYTTTFNSAPSGDWTVWIELPANHNGKVMSTGGSPAQVTAASPHAITVSGAGAGTPTTVAFTIAEAQLDLKVLATSLALDTNPAPATVSLLVKQGATTLYTAPTFQTSTSTTNNVTSIWVVPSLAYTLTANPGTSHGVGWTTATQSVTPASTSTATSAEVALTQKGGSLAITVKQKTGGALVDGATVSLQPADTLVTPPTDDVSDNKGLAGFTLLPPGDYTITATKTTTTGSGASAVTTTQTGAVTVTVTASATAQAVNVPIATVP